MLVGAAGKSNRRRLADTGVRAVAAGDERRLARLDGLARTLEAGDDVTAAFFEADELRAAFDGDAGLCQPVDQQPLVLVLRKDEGVRIRTDAGAHVAKHQARDLT